MPNNIKNRVTFITEDLEKIKKLLAGVNGAVDFDKIIPMPDCLRDFEPHCGIISRAQNAIGIPVDDIGLPVQLQYLERSNRERDCFTHIRDEDIPHVIRALQNYVDCRFFYWYDWCNENWHTKWNAYSIKPWRENSIIFETAWAGVLDLILELSKAIPETEILYTYADEDAGSNTGDLMIKGGTIVRDDSPENGTNRAYEIFLELNPDCDYIKLVDGQYRYVDDES